jgi:hypothetical protein
MCYVEYQDQFYEFTGPTRRGMENVDGKASGVVLVLTCCAQAMVLQLIKVRMRRPLKAEENLDTFGWLCLSPSLPN